MPVIREKTSSENLFSNFKKSEEEKSSDEDSIHLVFDADDRDESFSLDLDENKSTATREKDNQNETTSKCNDNSKEEDSDKENNIEKTLNGNSIDLVNGSSKNVSNEEEITTNCDNDDKTDQGNEENGITSPSEISEKDLTKDISANIKTTDTPSPSEVENGLEDEESDRGKLQEELREDETIKSSSIEEEDKNEEPKEESKVEDQQTESTIENSEQDAETNEEQSNDDTKKDEDHDDDKKTVSSYSEEELITFPKLTDKSSEPSENEEEKEERYGSPKPEEDLMDISIIRDVDEDNAKFSESNEKLSSDNEDQDDSDEKNSNEGEDENSSNEKENDIQMDCVEEESGIQGDKEEDSAPSESSDIIKDNKVSEMSNEELSNDNTTETIVQTKENQESMEVGISEDQSKSSKRLLPEDDETCNDSTKRLKLSETEIRQKIEDEIEKDVKVLKTFVEYMKKKKLYKQISRGDLEQFFLEKCCEVIVYKTNPGELRQRQIKQDEIIEQLKLQLGQLTKQCTDLQVVNKKLLSEVKHLILTKGKGELIPLKITRSVGLQVKSCSDPSKKKTIVSTSPKAQVVPNKIRPQVQPIAVRSVLPKSIPSSNNNGAPAPLLSHALQTRKRPSISPSIQKRVTPILNGKVSESKTKLNVIDLTDEDEKTKSPVTSLGVTYKTVPLKAVVSAANFSKTGQNKAVMKNGSTITLPASVVTTGGSTPQLMYVVQPTGGLPQGIMTSPGGTQKILVNFQPANGVLSSTLANNSLSLMSKTTTTSPVSAKQKKHPAPLPMPPIVKIVDTSLKPLPPKPHLSIRKTDTGIVLQWKMPYKLDIYESIASYQLYAYQETNAPPSTDMWRKVGDVKALALPMACTLTQFADKNKYYFAVRSVDVHQRIGPFSDPEEISL